MSPHNLSNAQTSDAKGFSTERTIWRSIYDEFMMLTALGWDSYDFYK
jgi:hypothetical protein